MNINMVEQWKRVEGYEGYYQVSNKGRVKSLSRKREGNGKKGVLQERILKGTTNSDGYPHVKLYLDGKGETKKVHRLVVEAFIKKDDNKIYINHIDGNKENNHVSNLERCTPSQNIRHAYREGLNPIKLNLDKDILEKLYIEEGMLHREIAEIMNCSRRSVGNYIKKYKIKRECL